MAQEREFHGRIGRDWRDSEPWWPPEPTPPAGAPNVVLVVLDDVGFAQLGCYGSDIATPGDRRPGRRRGATGQLPHHRPVLAHPGLPADRAEPPPQRHGPGGRPGRRLTRATGASRPEENGFLSEILRQQGYATYAVGKWHLTPEDETHMARSRATWPLARGFDRWYGFHGGETHQFVPALYHDNHAVRPPRRIEDGYHLSADLADRAIEFVGDLRAVDADRPFFLYFCTGACHSPHQAPRDVDRAVPGGLRPAAGTTGASAPSPASSSWASSRRAPSSPPVLRGCRRGRTWATSSGSVAARFMECFAGFLSYTDAQIGRLFAFLERRRATWTTPWSCWSRTTAPAPRGAREGSINDIRLREPRSGRHGRDVRADGRDRRARSPTTTTRGAGRWPATRPSSAGSARSTKVGWPIRASCSWPARFGPAAGGIRHQFAHAVDVLPTVLELVGIDAPSYIEGVAQSRIDGTSFAYLLGPEARGRPGPRT